MKTKISSKYGKHSFSSAFKWIDADRTGSITREEFKEALHKLNLAGASNACLKCMRQAHASCIPHAVITSAPLLRHTSTS